MSNVDDLLELGLCCPVPDCHGPLSREPERLICHTCKRAYPIEDDIPIMLIDRAIVQSAE